MGNDNISINVIDFNYLMTVRAGNPPHTLKVKISRGDHFHTGVILEHTNNKGVVVENISSPKETSKNPTQLLIDLVSKYLTQYDTSLKKPTFTIVK